MKKIVLIVTLLVATLTASASNTLYFTYNQALRTVTYLNNQDELMIYCGYADELPSYVIVNEVWAEQISSSFYEIWLYGYDAYTGEEVYMPIDLECIWLVRNGNIFSASQVLRFRSSHARPSFGWAMPAYHHFVRVPHPKVYYYSYHYDIHRPGWHYRHHPDVHYHPYYMRPPSHPAPLPHAPFVPGKERPGYTVSKGTNGETTFEYTPNVSQVDVTASRSKTIVQNDPSSRSGNRITNNRSDNTVTTTDRITGSRSTVTAPEVTRSESQPVGRSGNSGNSRGNAVDNSRSTSSSNGNTSTRSSNTSRSGNSATDRTNTGRSSNTSNNNTSTRSSDNSRSGSSSTSRTTPASNGSRSNNSATSRSASSNNNTSTQPQSSSRSGNSATGRISTTKSSDNSRSGSQSVGTRQQSTSSRGTSDNSRGNNTIKRN